MADSTVVNGRAGVAPSSQPGTIKKSKGKKTADATGTSNLISQTIANLEKSQAGNREQDQEIGMFEENQDSRPAADAFRTRS
jgi:hypothetical protein